MFADRFIEPLRRVWTRWRLRDKEPIETTPLPVHEEATSGEEGRENAAEEQESEPIEAPGRVAADPGTEASRDLRRPYVGIGWAGRVFPTRPRIAPRDLRARSEVPHAPAGVIHRSVPAMRPSFNARQPAPESIKNPHRLATTSAAQRRARFRVAGPEDESQEQEPPLDLGDELFSRVARRINLKLRKAPTAPEVDSTDEDVATDDASVDGLDEHAGDDATSGESD